MDENIIEKYYQDNNFPSSKKLYSLLKKEGYNFTQKVIDEYLKKKRRKPSS